ncbi:MAG: tetratricopeptide repeat protein, partial [Bacteroidetes bacterium]|nr:tetratricopeptide repeat protein [Bacteroidota bacterium]
YNFNPVFFVIIEQKLLNLDEDNFNYINKAYQIVNKEKDKERIADLDIIYSKYLKIFGNYSKSYEHLQKAKSYFEKTNNKHKTAVTYLGFGETYRVSGDLKQSLIVLAKAERIFSELKDTLGLAKAYNQIASVNYELKKSAEFEKAKKYAELSLELIKNRKNTRELFVNNMNILGAVSTALGDYKKAEEYLNSAFNNLTPELENIYKPLILIHFSQTYLSMKDYNSALRYAIESYKITKKTGLKLYLFWIESILSDLYADMGVYEKAYFFRNESNNHYQSIYGEKQRQRMMIDK